MKLLLRNLFLASYNNQTRMMLTVLKRLPDELSLEELYYDFEK